MAAIYRIGDLTLDPGRQVLRRDTERIRLGPLTWRLFLALVDAAPNVVSHDELARAVWRGRAVSPETISQRIKLLRKALGDDSHEPRYIELLRGQGIRLIPAVETMAASELEAKSQGRPGTPIGALLVIVAAVIATALLLARNESSTDVLDERADVSLRPLPPTYSIAVLPFENLNNPEQEYFAEGMHDALISELARIEGLTVISRTSAQHYADSMQTLSEIARELNVSTIVEGSVLRSADKVRIQIRLVGIRPERNLLAQTYDRELGDTLKLHREITRDIANRIEVKLSARERSRLAETGTLKGEAYTLWLKGNFHLSNLNEESFRKAVDYYKAAIGRDPQYAAAYAGLAMAYMQSGSWHGSQPPADVVGPARKAAERALALDPSLAEAYLALGYISAQSDWDWRSADSAFRKGVALNPSNTLARLEYANFLTAMGRFDDSINYGTRTLQMDPLSAAAYGELAFAYWLSGRDEEALKLYREGLELAPGRSMLVAELYLTRGDVDEALPYLAPFDEGALDTLSPPQIGVLGRLNAMAGREREARALLADLLERRQRAFVPAVPIAYIHLGLGEKAEALEWLEVAYEERDVSLIWLKVLPAYDSVRSTPRFQKLLERMKFPAAP